MDPTNSTQEHLPGYKLDEQIPSHAVVIPRPQHVISRANISENALKVLYRLKHEGFSAYLVGGGVRDLLLGREPKDFDIVTNALPEQVRHCFRNAILIGRRFRLVHVLFKNEIVEVSTFRAHREETSGRESQSEHGMVLEDNAYGTFAEDAIRRDFTINSLYYNIYDFSVVDCHQGLNDLQQGVIRVIGEPRQRYREDPVRMLRAARFSAKLGFRIHEDSERPIFESGTLLNQVPAARLFNETEKLFLTGMAVSSYKVLRHYGLFKYLFPLTEQTLSGERYEHADRFINLALEDTDLRVAQNKPANTTFLVAVLLWHALQDRIEHYVSQGEIPAIAFECASSEILREQSETIAIPRRFSVIIREIWFLQNRFLQRQKSKVSRTIQQPRFRGAFDFLKLRARSGEPLEELVQWWKQFYDQDSRKMPSYHQPYKRKRRFTPKVKPGSE